MVRERVPNAGRQRRAQGNGASRAASELLTAAGSTGTRRCVYSARRAAGSGCCQTFARGAWELERASERRGENVTREVWPRELPRLQAEDVCFFCFFSVFGLRGLSDSLAFHPSLRIDSASNPFRRDIRPFLPSPPITGLAEC